MLDDLHMVHRDLKPDNILVSPTGHLAVADFGFATHFSAKTWPTVKMTQAMGTPGYFAPEMFSKDLYRDGYTSSVDRWGLGMILLEMFSGEVSFDFTFINYDLTGVYTPSIVLMDIRLRLLNVQMST